MGEGGGSGSGRVDPERRKEFLQMVVEEVVTYGNNNVDVTSAIPIESKPTTEVSVQTFEPSFGGLNRHGKLKYSWAVGLGPFKPGRVDRQ